MLLSSACLAALPTPAWSLPAPEPAVAGALGRRIAKLVSRAPLPGLAVAAVQDRSVIYSSGFGLANVRSRQPVTADTPFLLASVSKLVTGVAALQLIERGQLSLGTDAQSLLPFSVRNPSYPGDPITVEMLMDHTSSIRDNYTIANQLYTDGDPELSLGEFLGGYLVQGGELYQQGRNYYRTAPGEEGNYSNVGIALLGLLVERASGVPFDAYCESNIFAPLGMDNTSWKLAGLDPALVAMPYLMSRNRLGRVRFGAQGHYGFPDYPNGLLRSSVNDLARFLIMLMNDGSVDGVRVLQESTIDLMRRATNRDIDPLQGLVGYYEEAPNGLIYGHDGAESGVATRLFFRIEDRRGVIVLTNGDTDFKGVQGALNRIESLLFGY